MIPKRILVRSECSTFEDDFAGFSEAESSLASKSFERAMELFSPDARISTDGEFKLGALPLGQSAKKSVQCVMCRNWQNNVLCEHCINSKLQAAYKKKQVSSRQVRSSSVKKRLGRKSVWARLGIGLSGSFQYQRFFSVQPSSLATYGTNVKGRLGRKHVKARLGDLF